MPVITGATAYPDDPLASLALYRVESADALGIAVECGSQKALNLVLLGMFSRLCPLRRRPGGTPSPPVCRPELWKSTLRPSSAAAP